MLDVHSMPCGSVGGYFSSVIIEKVSSTVRALHETFMAWVVIVQKGKSSSFIRKRERLLLLLMGLSVFHLTVTIQCVLRGERKKLNSQCEQGGVGGSPHHRFADPFVEHLECFETLLVCFTYISDVKLYLSRKKGKFVFQLSSLGKYNSTLYPQCVN